MQLVENIIEITSRFWVVKRKAMSVAMACKYVYYAASVTTDIGDRVIIIKCKNFGSHHIGSFDHSSKHELYMYGAVTVGSLYEVINEFPYNVYMWENKDRFMNRADIKIEQKVIDKFILRI